jgi:UDP-glucose 4-epimerase
MLNKIFIVGGAGCIGSHFCDYLLAQKNTEKVTVYDNFSSGRAWHLALHENDKRFHLVKGDIANFQLLQSAIAGHDIVIHLASNPDIARAAKEPAIDFEQGTMLTHNVLEAMRITGVRRILYASGSGIYGDVGYLEIPEDHGPLIPTSTYGASKLAGEALISSYCYMFDMSGLAFRFGNVVGARQTHGVGFDFINKLRANNRELHILGDGKQSKSYVHISDIVNAVLLANKKVEHGFAAFNIATGDYITVTEIADIVIRKVVGDKAKVKLIFSGGDRGWKGDIPIVRLNTNKIKALGWQCHHTSAQAIERSIDEMLKEKEHLEIARNV